MLRKSLVALACAASACAFAAADAATFTYSFTISDIQVDNDDPNYRASISGSGKLFADFSATDANWSISGATGSIATTDWGAYQVTGASGTFLGDDSNPNMFSVAGLSLSGLNDSNVSNDFYFFNLPLEDGGTQLIGLLGESGGDATFSISQDASSDVPEPASWAMMVGGFGLMGMALRRRKVSVTFA